MVGHKQHDIGANNNGTHNPGTRGPDSLSGRSDPADPDTGQRQQDAGHYTASGAQGERAGGIVKAPPESNVGPAGAPQSSRGSAGGTVAGEKPTRDTSAEPDPEEPDGAASR